MNSQKKDFDPIHYRHFLASVARAAEISPSDLAIICDKPPGAEQARDRIWRQRCASCGILTTAIGTSYDRAAYLRGRTLERRVKDLEKVITEQDGEIRLLKSVTARDVLEKARRLM